MTCQPMPIASCWESTKWTFSSGTSRAPSSATEIMLLSAPASRMAMTSSACPTRLRNAAANSYADGTAVVGTLLSEGSRR
jgi:hypothetical protein